MMLATFCCFLGLKMSENVVLNYQIKVVKKVSNGVKSLHFPCGGESGELSWWREQ